MLKHGASIGTSGGLPSHLNTREGRRVPSPNAYPGILTRNYPIPTSPSHVQTIYSVNSICLNIAAMVRGIEGNEMSTPRPSQKKKPASASQSAKNQKSILGFFQKKSTNSPSPAPPGSSPLTKNVTTSFGKQQLATPPQSRTPIPSSDVPEHSSPIKQDHELTVGRNKENGQHPSIVSCLRLLILTFRICRRCC